MIPVVGSNDKPGGNVVLMEKLVGLAVVVGVKVAIAVPIK